MCWAMIPPGQEWAVIGLCVVLLVEAYIDLMYLKVPNKITYPVIFAAWIYAFVMGWVHGMSADQPPKVPFELFWYFSFDLYSPLAYALAYLWTSVAMTFISLGLLIWLYAIGGMGAGDVKMLSGYGAWIVNIYGWEDGFWLVLWSFAFAVIIGGVISAIMIWWRGEYKQNIKNVREILSDIASSRGKVPEIAQKAAERKPRL